MGKLTKFPISSKIKSFNKIFFDLTRVNFGVVFINLCHFWCLYGEKFFSKRGLSKSNEILTQNTEDIKLTWVENVFL